MSYKNHSMMLHVKLMKNQMHVLIGQIHGDFKVTAKNFGQVYMAILFAHPFSV